MSNPRVINVDLADRSYEILVEPGSLSRAGSFLAKFAAGKKCLLVSDDQVFPLYGAKTVAALEDAGALAVSTHVFSAGEANKTFSTVEGICRQAAQSGLERGSLLVALGGGVVGDLAGFAAAIYMRGVDFVQIPTTLLAMVDSSVGGKTGADLPEGKNLIGAFWQPKFVLADPETLSTLPEREVKGGLAEVIKYGVILDRPFFELLAANVAKLKALDLDFYGAVVARCCELKAAVVVADEKESGVRALLNYGHTFGHALEKVTGFSAYIHGEAVAVGMLMAARAAGLPEVEEAQRALFAALDMPTRAKGATPEALLSAMGADKKVQAGKIRLVLPEALGKAKVVPVGDPALVLDAMRPFCD